MVKEKTERKKIRIPSIKIPKIKLPTIKTLSTNTLKQILAIIMLIAEFIAVIGSSIYGFQAGAVTLVLFGVITYDYIRVLRAEKRAGPWYEIENVE